MRIPTGGPDADSADIRQQVETARHAVSRVMADLDGSVEAADDATREQLADLALHLCEAWTHLEAAARLTQGHRGHTALTDDQDEGGRS